MGLYSISDGQVCAIGYQRGVIEALGPAHREVERLASENSYQESELYHQRNVPFPSLDYMPDSQSILNICRLHRGAGDLVGESSRFVLDESVRSIRLSLFFVQCVIARYMFVKYWRVGLTAIRSSSKRAYVELGFTQPEGFHDRYVPLLECKAAPLRIESQNVAPRLVERYRELALEFQANGSICADESIVDKVLKVNRRLKRVA